VAFEATQTTAPRIDTDNMGTVPVSLQGAIRVGEILWKIK